MRDHFGQESALIVPVPSAETVVGPWRESLDPACEWGVPAHITVLYPFVPPAEIDSKIHDRLQDVVAQVPAFDFRLTSVEWFADDVAWARPDPDGPFRDLTARVSEAWPGFPPYEGAFKEVIPHLTICQGADPYDMASAAAAVAEYMPIHARADRVRLMAGRFEADSWTTLAEFRLRDV